MATEYKLSYTANEINTKLGQIDNLAEKNEIPTKTSQLANDSEYVTKEELNEAVKNIDVPEVNIAVDTTLSVEGQAADAKAVGNALETKIDKAEIREINAIEIASKMGLISPTAAEDGSIYTDENGALYSL